MPDLTHRQRDILHQLRFREAGEEDASRRACWVVGAERQRVLIIVPTMYGIWDGWSYVRESTLAHLVDAGLVELGETQYTPGDVRRTGAVIARRLTLTALGRAERE